MGVKQQKPALKVFLWLFVLVGYGAIFYYYGTFTLGPREWVAQQLKLPAADNGIWDAKFLTTHTIIAEKLARFEAGELCYCLKTLDNSALTHAQLKQILKNSGYTCFLKALTLKPHAKILQFLKKDGSTSYDPQAKELARQEVCVKAEEGCVVRFKMDGFPHSKKPQPHSTKALLINLQGDPSNYYNEAFKITSSGRPVPKGPGTRSGWAPCPYLFPKQCALWVDAVMAAAHPDLREPLPSSP